MKNALKSLAIGAIFGIFIFAITLAADNLYTAIFYGIGNAVLFALGAAVLFHSKDRKSNLLKVNPKIPAPRTVQHHHK